MHLNLMLLFMQEGMPSEAMKLHQWEKIDFITEFVKDKAKNGTQRGEVLHIFFFQTTENCSTL